MGCVSNCPTCTLLRSALAALFVERAWSDMTASAVAGAAGISVTAFLEHYPSVAACGMATFDEAAAECYSVCAAAYFPRRDCGERFRHMAEAVGEWTAARPGLAWVLFVLPSQAHDPALLDRLSMFKRQILALFDQPGRCSPAGGTHVEFLIGLFFQSAHRQLVNAGGPRMLRGQAQELAPFVV